MSNHDKNLKLDSLLVQYRAKPTDSILLKLILKKSFITYREKQLDSTIYFEKLLYKKASEINDQKYMHTASRNLGVDYKSQQINDSAYYYYNLAKGHALNLKDSFRIASNYLSLGKIQNNFSDFYGAEEMLVEALRYFDIHKDSVQLADTYNILGLVQSELLNYEEAKSSHSRAIQFSNDSIRITGYKNNLAIIYEKEQKYDEAIVVLEKILDWDILDTTSYRYARILDNLGYSRWKYNGEDVERNLLSALNIRRSLKDYRGQIASYGHLGEFYAKSQPKRSLAYMDSLLWVGRRIKMPEAELNALEQLMALLPNQHQYKDRYIVLRDSLYQSELRAKTQFAKMRYDDEREKSRLLALEAETSQKEVQLSEQRIQKVLLLSITTTLLLGGIIFYLFLRQKHNREKQNEIYQTEKRISQDLHDGLANDLFGMMTMVQGQEKNDVELLDKLDSIYQTTRQISHDNSTIEIGPGFKDELLYLIGAYQLNGTQIVTNGIHRIEWEHLDMYKCIAVHRTLKELLVNTKKHANATLVSINFKSNKKLIQITYSDNGVGLGNTNSKGIGLINTENRIHAVKGKFNLEPKSDGGIKASITIPLKT